jgi:ribosomal protein L11 methyltransferase
MNNPYDLKRNHGAYPARYLNLASGDGILVLDIQAALEAIAVAEGKGVSEAETLALLTSVEDVIRPSAARRLYARLRECANWERCPHGYATTMSLSAAGPQRIGPFLVRAPWHPASAGALDIVIQPGLSFGLGTHATTRLPLLRLPAVMRLDLRCADVGCGSGVLAIAMAGLGAREVAAVDVSPVAVAEAQENVRLNQAIGITVTPGSADSLDGLFDVITANMGGAPSVVEIAPHVAAHLLANGVFLASGIYGETDEQAARVADGVAEALAPMGLAEVRRDTEHQCVGIVFRRTP